MLKPAAFICTVLLFAGCYTPLPKKDGSPVSDWQEPGSVTNRAPEKAAPVPRASQPAPRPAPVTSPTPVTHRAVTTWMPLGGWAAEHHLPAPRRVASVLPESFALVSTNGIFSVQPGSTSARWNGMELRLGFKPLPVIHSNDVVLHWLDLKKNLEPLLLPGLQSVTGRVVVLDPGHGGAEAGTCGADGVCEKMFTLDWALRLARLLETNGWTVRLTRTNDVEVSLPARVEFAEREHADVFVSLHFNHSGGGAAPAGVETYCLTPVGMESTLTRGYPDNIREVFPNNAFDAENLRLAAGVHRELLAVPGNADRGIRRARFPFVLRGQHRPAVLIEGGFLSNPAEAQRISSAAHRQKLAEAVCAALMKLTEGGAIQK